MTDTVRKIFCPACGEEIRKFYIESAGCYVDVCLTGCGGIYFDKDELSKMDEAHEKIPELFELFKDKDFMLVDKERARMCPVCNHIMVKQISTQNKEIEIDECKTCGGIFLDFNELFQIRKEDLNNENDKTEFTKKVLEEFNINYNKQNNEISNPINCDIANKIIKSIYNL